MQVFLTSPKEMVRTFWQNRQLISVLTKRDVLGRYRGSVMGLMWSFLNPAIMLMIYTFVFSVVFKARWNVDTQSKTEFALILFSGLIIFNLFSECASRAPSLILSNANYVKRVVFPLEILPIVSLAASLVHAFISFVVWLIAYCIFMGVPHIMILLIPFVVLPLLLLILGVTWGLASLGVFLRDVSQFIGMVVTAFLFMSPIFYPITALPEKYRVILRLNPLSPALEQTRDVLFWNKMPDIRIWILYLMLSAIVSWLGFYFFQKTRKGFADVL